MPGRRDRAVSLRRQPAPAVGVARLPGPHDAARRLCPQRRLGLLPDAAARPPLAGARAPRGGAPRNAAALTVTVRRSRDRRGRAAETRSGRVAAPPAAPGGDRI